MADQVGVAFDDRDVCGFIVRAPVDFPVPAHPQRPGPHINPKRPAAGVLTLPGHLPDRYGHGSEPGERHSRGFDIAGGKSCPGNGIPDNSLGRFLLKRLFDNGFQQHPLRPCHIDHQLVFISADRIRLDRTLPQRRGLIPVSHDDRNRFPVRNRPGYIAGRVRHNDFKPGQRDIAL